MSQLPVITDALVMPGVSPTDSAWTLLVGLIIDGRQIAWGECTFAPADSDPDGRLNEGIHILQEIIIPALIGQPLANVTALMSRLDEMRREVTLVKAVTAETLPHKRSRRELFTSLLNPEQEIREIVERPLPPELRHGVSQALFSAVSLVQDTSIVEAITQLYTLQPAKSPPPIHLEFDDLPNPTDPALARTTAASYGLTVSEMEPARELGAGGVRLQNRVRQLKNRAAHHLSHSPSPFHREIGFLFDLKGGYRALYGQKSGPILGALSGLEQVTKPYPLRLVDPVILDDKQSQMDMMKELQSFIRLRKMNVTLLAHAWVETAEDIGAFAQNDCCGGVLIDLSQMGTLHHSIELALAARKSGLEIILAGVTGKAAVHAALALNPTLLSVTTAGHPAIANEIGRTLAWLEYK
jgi:methylaspartate ammonia-lyase